MKQKGRSLEDYGRQIRAVVAFAVFGGVSCAMQPLCINDLASVDLATMIFHSLWLLAQLRLVFGSSYT